MNREALVVGINRYPFLKKEKLGDLNLKAPVKDAEAITDILERYGNFRVQRLPKGYDEEGKERFISDGLVKINDLQQAIINLFNPPLKKEVPDVALLFFAGHGYLTTEGGIREGYLVTSDAQLNRNIYGISLAWLKKLLQESPVKKQIVWLDCCFSGELLNFDQEFDPGTEGKQISRCLITSCRSFEKSVEQLSGEHGIFTAKLLEGLNPNNPNNIDGWVTNYKLAEFIKQNMSQTSQAPMFHNSGYAIILTTNTPNQPIDKRWKNVAPYRGLSYFQQQENDAVFFHGRTRLTDELIDRVRTNNFVAVLGASGSGKSSLLRAGLLYQLKQGQKISGSDRWLYINPFTPTASPLESLQQAIEIPTVMRYIDDPPKSPLERGTLKTPTFLSYMEEGAKTIPHRHNIEEEQPENLTEKLIEFIEVAEVEKVVMIIDQFEEVFTQCQGQEQKEQERQKFFDVFLEALERQADKFCLVLGMRADFLDRCSEYAGLANQIKQHQLLVTPLQEEEIKEAIKKPAELVGIQVQDGLITKITEDFMRNPGSLPLLQYTLDALWKSAIQGEDKSQYLTLATYRKLGGIKSTLTKRANEVFESLSKKEKSVAKRIFLELVQPGEQSINSGKITDTRRRVILEKLPNQRHSLELLSKVSNKLADKNNRLITKDKSEGGTVLDIIHEDLIRSWKTLREWVEEYQEVLPLERKIEADAAEWEKDGKKDNYLMPQGLLDKAQKYLIKYGKMGLLDGVAYEFINASSKQEKRKRRNTQKLNLLLSFISIFLTWVSAFAWMQQTIAKYNSEISRAPQLAAETELLRANNLYDTSVLLGVESMHKIQKLKGWPDSWWRKVVRIFFGSQFSSLPQNAVDGVIRKGLTQLPDHLHTFNHQGWVRAVAFSCDGKTIATGSNDYTARLWDTDTGKELAILNHPKEVNVVAFSCDGKTIATGSHETAHLWDANTGKELATLKHKAPSHNALVNAVVFSPDGQTIATASDDYTARLWDVNTGKEIVILNHQNPVNVVAFSRDGQTIATASSDNTARLWDADTGKELATLNHQYMVRSVVSSRDGKIIATVSNDFAARLWDAHNGKELPTLKHQNSVIAVSFSPDEEIIATATDDNTAHLWDANTGKELATLNHQGRINTVAFSPSGKSIATGSDDNTVRLWDTDNGKELAIFNHQGRVNTVVFSPDSQTIVTASYENTARLWAADTHKELATLNHQDKVNAVALSPDGQIIATATDDNTAHLWDANTGKGLATLNHQGRVSTVAFSRDGKTIATGSWDNTARLWDTTTGKELATLNHEYSVHAVAFSPNGKTIATASSATARLWDTTTGKELATLKHKYGVDAVAFSRDGKTIATASNDNIARFWDARTGKELATLNYHGWVNAIAFSPDGKTIATANNDNTARLWDADTRKELAILNHQGKVNTVVFSPDGKTVVTVSDDKTARLWDVDTKERLATFNHQNSVIAVAFSRDGQTIATASTDQTTHLWRWATPKALIQEACNRLSRNLTAREWQQYINSDLKTYRKTCKNLPVHPSVNLK
ncbi:MAG: PQQ-binding-like beta-propeller repeat protein [Okeania sp. SIO3B5]|uniref:nSTAND1 domain-containing NTPase n=1 Tax=Okeania sp. SIO3B5 TaxID=2607811 RepID=UPI001400C211|nr:caspase family protein [Okeania sp. SIO3B5]NEO52894.1 PQQ-binding-like beta-propeller repeat protein [Okeania sp. SIO3B5]